MTYNTYRVYIFEVSPLIKKKKVVFCLFIVFMRLKLILLINLIFVILKIFYPLTLMNPNLPSHV